MLGCLRQLRACYKRKKKNLKQKTNTKISLFNLSKQRTATGLLQTYGQGREAKNATEHF